jgi:ABC-2 type transport system permease protein
MFTNEFGYRLYALVRHTFILTIRDPGPIIAFIAMPMLMMAAFRPVYTASNGTVSGTARVTIGAIILFSLITLNIIGQNMFNERTWRTWDRMRTTPASSIELLLGKVIPFYVLLVGQQMILLLYSTAAFRLHINRPAAALVIMLAWSAAVLGLGLMLASVARTLGQLSTITDIGAIAITVLGGGLSPVREMPGWMQSLAPYSPGYWAIEGYQQAISGSLGIALLRPVAVLLIIAIAAMTVAAWRTASRFGASRQP